MWPRPAPWLPSAASPIRPGRTTSSSSNAPDASQDAFIPPAQASYQREELGKSLVRAMIAAAKADGQIDSGERDRIFKRLETMPLSAEEKAFVFDELSSPLDIEAVVARADTPEHAAEIYAASLVAMVPDTPEERTYLASLAARLKLDPGTRRRDPSRRRPSP